MTDVERRAAAKKFAEDWKGKGYEKGQCQPFWLSLLQKVYGVEEPEKYNILRLLDFNDNEIAFIAELDKDAIYTDGSMAL